MKKRIVSYTSYIDKILEEQDRDWDKEIEKHLTQIAFFSHERLVHLIVFALVAICTVISILAYVISEKIILLPLIIMLFILLVPYLKHYYLLENKVQYMYKQYDKMIAKKEKYFTTED